MHGFFLMIIFLWTMNYLREGYTNYRSLANKPASQNCPQEHANSFEKLAQNYQTIQPFGYTKNVLFDITRFVKTDIPLPVDPDFFGNV